MPGASTLPGMGFEDRIFGPIRAFVLSILNERLFGLYTYAVESFDEGAGTISAKPLGNNKDLPPVSKVAVRTPLLKIKVPVGSQVMIGFEGGDPTLPFCAHLDFMSAYASALAIVRQGDMVGVPFLLSPAVVNGATIPNMFWITFDPTAPPPPPPFTPTTGGPVTFYGTTTTGSQQNGTL